MQIVDKRMKETLAAIGGCGLLMGLVTLRTSCGLPPKHAGPAYFRGPQRGRPSVGVQFEVSRDAQERGSK